jgi:hypothetical protein
MQQAVLARTCLFVVLVGGISSIGVDARASVVPAGQGDGGWAGNGSGNGRHNRNSFIINSPSMSHDVQHIRNVNVGGQTITPAALCKRPAGRCKIVQHIVVYGH